MTFVSTRSLGAGTEVSTVHSGVIHWTPQFPLDELLDGNGIARDDDGNVLLGHNWLVVRTPHDVVAVDPSEWDPDEDYGQMVPADRHPVREALAKLGLTPEDVTHVVITHGHVDHTTGLTYARDGERLARFPNAQLHFPAADYQAFVVENESGRAERLREQLDPVERLGLLRLVSGDADVCPGVRVLATPGESPGHQVVCASGADDAAYYLGDQIHWDFEFLRPDWTPMDGKDGRVLGVGRRRVLAEAAGLDALVVFTHAPFPAWGRIVPEGDAWRWRPV